MLRKAPSTCVTLFYICQTHNDEMTPFDNVMSSNKNLGLSMLLKQFTGFSSFSIKMEIARTCVFLTIVVVHVLFM